MDSKPEVAMNGGTNYRCCLKIPEWFTQELKRLLKLSWPIILVSVMQYMTTVISMIFCGQLGTTVLAGVALATMVINISVVSVGQGLTTACDTLFSQSFGSTNKMMVGIYLQRSLFILFLASIAIAAFLLNVETILLVTGQTAVTATIASEYALLFIPGTLANFQYQVLSRYLMNQNLVMPLIFISTLSNVLNALVHYLLIYQADLGYHGSSLALSLCHISLLTLTIIYILWSKVYEMTWPGWRIESLQDWSGFTKLGIPGLIMVFSDFFVAEIGTILAGLLGEVQIATMTIVSQLTTVTYQASYGVGVGTSVLVGQNLGFGDSRGAKRSALVGITTGLSTGAFTTILYLTCRNYLPMIFSNDPNVVSLTALLLWVPGAYQILAALMQTESGILRGAGRQRRGAICMATSWLLASPISICLMMFTDLGVIGFYLGMLSAVIFGSLTQAAMLARLDWDNEVERAALVANVGDDDNANEVEPNDKSSLLPNSENGSKYGAIPSKKFGVKEGVGARLYLKRFAIILLVLAILAGGILAKLFIKVEQVVGDCGEVVCNSTALPTDATMTTASSSLLTVPDNHTVTRLFWV